MPSEKYLKQNKHIHALRQKAGLDMDGLRDIAEQMSGVRSVSQLSEQQRDDLIRRLTDKQAAPPQTGLSGAANAVYRTDPHKFSRIQGWINWAKKKKYTTDDIEQALLAAHKQSITGNWWSYLCQVVQAVRTHRIEAEWKQKNARESQSRNPLQSMQSAFEKRARVLQKPHSKGRENATP